VSTLPIHGEKKPATPGQKAFGLIIGTRLGRMKASVLAALVIAAVFGGLIWWLRTYHHTSGAVLIALGAFAVSCFAQFQASRSAHLATKNEKRSRYGWAITVHPDGDRYVLRNTGTLLAHDVTLAADERTFVRFENHEGTTGPDIPHGQSKAFHATFTMMSAPGNEVQIVWLPDGEKKRRVHFDVLEPIPNKQFDEAVKRNEVERDSEATMRRQWCVEIRRLLIDLGDAWGAFNADATPQNKTRVQALVGALPSNMVREIGYAVDVPRDFWGPGQWPLELWTQDENDKKLVRENSAMVELMWNLTWVQIPRVGEGDISQNPDPWHRIEHAVRGYVELVRNREQGKRELRDGPRDRKHRENALQMMKQNEAMLRRHTPPTQQPESN
jgi:hypothetical protein